MSEPLKILIVDDQPGVRYLLDIVIREVGHQVYTARNGLEAVDIAKASHPDLVFMDVRMPLMGGLEALGKIKAMLPETEVIIMTAYGSEETVTRAMEGGALCCIAKPFDVEKIKELLENMEWKHSCYKKTLIRDYA
ncbi:Sporulation initiation phosphotransferase F [Pelotomaculum schinkii]|uniref:Stage 0 sporulation protein A homolog n=1 Tax=Pelotomaculum schinkii TaxID=78350 RepID=A0A4Y7RFA6_9FIRM|nr:response regulator [Pelotomaculum schinkii]TEB07461.1 Sporulation initiation phosphotransferase F [Pelotomaculum schinkii]